MSSASLPAQGITDPVKIYILDSSAVLRYLDREAGYTRVHSLIRAHQLGSCQIMMTSIHWGEVAHRLVRRHGESRLAYWMQKLLSLEMEIVPATAERAVRSARIQARLRIPYADAFGVELASDSANHVFVTADYDLKPAATEVQIQFLPAK